MTACIRFYEYIVTVVIRLRRLVAGPLTAEVRVQYQSSPYETCGGQSGTGTEFSPNTSVFPCQYYATNGPYSFIYPLLMLCNLYNWQRW